MTSDVDRGEAAAVGREFSRGLAGFIGAQLGEEVEIRSLRRHLEGFSWETYSISLRGKGSGGAPPRELIVHREPTAGILAPYDARLQWELRRALGRVEGVPVPATLWLDADGEATGRPLYVVEKVAGDIPTQWTADEYFGDEGRRRAVARELMAIAATLHAMPVADLPRRLREWPPPVAMTTVEALEQRYLETRMGPLPPIDWGLAWLKAHADEVADRPPALIHGDLRVGNFIVADGAIVALLDWELAHLGDPVRDLAHCGLRLYRGRGGRASGLLPFDQLVAEYEAAAGSEVSRRALAFWTVFETVWATVLHEYAAGLFAAGATRDVRYATLSWQNHYMWRYVFEAIREAGD